MEITLSYRNQFELYVKWITSLNPVLKLREETEIPVLAALYLIYTVHISKGYNTDDLNTLLFNEGTKLSICSKLGISERSFNKSIKGIEEAELIVNRRLIENYLPDDFKITYGFRYEESADNG